MWRFKAGSLKILTILIFIAALHPGARSAWAQDKFVAVIITGDLPRYQQAHDAFLEVLKKGGMTEEDVQIYVQTPNPDPMSWANSIRKAEGVGADLIVTYGAPATLVAKKEARRTPVLFADVYDPVALGIIKDLKVPGGNISGVSGKTPLETLVKTAIKVRTVKTLGVLYSSEDPASMLQLEELERLAPKYGFSLVKQDANRPREVPEALQALSQSDMLFLSESAEIRLRLREVLDGAVQQGVPVISQIPGACDLGALMTLEADPSEQGKLVAVYALQVLAGKKAHTLPVFKPKKVSLVVNLKTAKKLGLTVPFQSLSVATRVIK